MWFNNDEKRWITITLDVPHYRHTSKNVIHWVIHKHCCFTLISTWRLKCFAFFKLLDHERITTDALTFLLNSSFTTVHIFNSLIIRCQFHCILFKGSATEAMPNKQTHGRPLSSTGWPWSRPMVLQKCDSLLNSQGSSHLAGRYVLIQFPLFEAFLPIIRLYIYRLSEPI